MKIPYNSRLFRLTGIIFGVLLWLANATNPPTGKSGAPFDGHCNECHGGGNPNGFGGQVDVSGLPSTIEPNTTYPLTITLTPTAGTPIRGGFQLVVVDGNNSNAGDLTAGNAQSGTEFFNGREYLEHRGAKNFTGGGPASWTFTWKSPITAANNSIGFYFIGNFTNGNNQDSGDYPVDFSSFYSFNGLPPLTAFISNTTDVLCTGGNNGSATVEASGGAQPYTYLWSNGQNGQTAINLSAGTYTVTVTGSSGTGTVTATAFISQPPILNLSASVSGILTCVNTSVTATANASGGTGPYFYEWSNGNTGNPTQLTMPGSHNVTVTDNNGCTKVAFVNVSSNLVVPNVEAGPGASLTCNQPTATLNGAGSSAGPTFSYLWTASNGGNIVSGATTLTPLVDAAGLYTLVVTNATNGCTSSDNTTVTQGTQPPTAMTSGDTLTCTMATGIVSVSTNASQPQFNWAGPNGFTSTEQNPAVTIIGTYTVTITDQASGCTNTATATVAENTTAPSVSATGDTITCATPSVTISATSGTSGVTYAWTGPNNFSSNQQNPSVSVAGTYVVVATDPANGCTDSDTTMVAQNNAPPLGSVLAEQLTCADTLAQITTTTNANPASFAWAGPGGFTSNLQNPEVNMPGNYTVTITNGANGCTTTAVAMVTQNINAPTASATVPGNLNCQVSSLQINGTTSSQGANFQYLWTTTNGNITAGATTLTPTVDAAGDYTLRVTNSNNGCTATTSVTLMESPPVVIATSVLNNVLCNGGADGTATASGTGGSGNGYSYLWSSGANTDTADALSAGTYMVTVTDSENCTSTASVTITQPAVLNANATATGETSLGASDGTATAAPSGGTTPYTYLWSTSGTTEMISGLAPGNYTVTITDNNACTAVQTVTVNSFNCTISATTAVTNVSCNGAADGSATANVSGAAQPVTFLWSNGDTTATSSNLAPGTYTVAILDANNCPAELSVQITSPAVLLANASATPETGIGLNNGTATAQPTGGTSPYIYMWSNGSTMQTITGLAPGPYTVTVTDDHDCTVVRTVTVNAFNCNLGGSISTANISCNGGNNGQATAVTTGGTAPISYSWSNGDTTQTTMNLAVGTYTVTATDANGCETVSSATITEPPVLQADIADVIPTSCPESQDGSASVVILGGTAPYQFMWPNGSGGQNLAVGTYIVSVTDANDCTTTTTATITSNDTIAPGITCPSAALIFCFGASVQFTPPPVSDNCALNGATPELIAGLPSGSTFPVGETVQVYQIKDVSGNTATCSFSIVVGPAIELKLDSVKADIGNAGLGSIDVTVSGGTGTLIYSWEKDGVPFADTEDLTGLQAGVYTLMVTDENGCTQTLMPVVVDNTVGTSTPFESAWVRIVPNPATQTFRLEMDGVQPMAMQFFNMQGRLLRTLKAAEWAGEIDITELPTGMHFLRILDQNGNSLMIKWIKAD
ncbi:MAG: T9SS type A sorting domain-containing protein [Lewinellaceae bacterium]|nr:T9SS type A sorting domain-containing protein [Lewinellaceae bacterium]